MVFERLLIDAHKLEFNRKKRFNKRVSDRSTSLRTIFYVGTLASILFLDKIAYADFYAHFWHDETRLNKELKLELEVRGTGASLNFDSTGTRFIPTQQPTLNRVETDLTVGFGITSWWTLFARGSLQYVQVSGTSGTGYTFGFADQSVGTSFRVFSLGPKKNISLDLQAQADLPAYSNSQLNSKNQPFPGDGTYDVSGGLFLRAPFAYTKGYLFGIHPGMAFTYRTSGFSYSLPWSALLIFEPEDPRTDGAVIGLGLSGAMSIGNDARTATPFGADGSTGNLGLYTVNAINPTHLAFRGKAGYRFKKNWTAIAHAGAVVWGLNAPQSFWGGISLKFEWSPQTTTNKPKSGNESHSLPEKIGKSNQGFVTYREKSVPENDGRNGPGQIIELSAQKNTFQIDRGAMDGVEKDQIFDIFKPQEDGSAGIAVARAKVMRVNSRTSQLEIVEYFRKIWIENGFLVLRPVD
jgi:hypothetical protein